jgi:signal transduction histidine kinase
MPQQDAIEESLVEQPPQAKGEVPSEVVPRAHLRAERRLRELNVLVGVLKSAAALVDEERLMSRVVDAAVYLTGAEEGFLLLLDEESGELNLRAARGSKERSARQLYLKVGDSLATRVVQTGKPIIHRGAGQDASSEAQKGYPVRPLIHMPLKIGERVLGVLSVHHRTQDRRFDDHSLKLLSALADSAVVALEHARLQARPAQPCEVISEAATPVAGVTSAAGEAPTAVENLQVSGQGPSARSRLQGALEGLQAYQAQVRTCIESARTILTDLREQAVSFEARLAEIASKQGVSPVLEEGNSLLPAVDIKREMREILDNVDDGILVVDAEGQIELANRAASVMLGRALTGQALDCVCADPRWSKTYNIVRAAAQIEGGAPGSEITSATTPLSVEQSVLSATFRVQPALDKGLPGTVVVLKDIAAEREAERAKDFFVASISHELRTPMTTIRGYADLLASGSVGALSDAEQKLVQRIGSSAQRVQDVLDDLAEMSTVDGKQLRLRHEEVDLTAVVHEVCGSMRLPMAERDQIVELYLEPNLPVVQADPDVLYHVLITLLRNAHRSSPRGAHIVLRVVKMRAPLEARDGLYVSVSISDEGEGIRPDDHRRVFDRRARAHGPGVSGLGDPWTSLPVVKVLVEAMGGRIWLDSMLSQGSTFTCVLPTWQGAGRGKAL